MQRDKCRGVSAGEGNPPSKQARVQINRGGIIRGGYYYILNRRRGEIISQRGGAS